MITVYTRPGCPACVGTMRYLERHGLDYRTVDVDEDPVAPVYLASLGYRSLPVVVAGAQSWCGLKIDKLAALKPAESNDNPVTVDP